MGEYKGFRIVLTTAPAGSGKSYDRTRYIVDEFLPDGEGIVVTNLPLKIDEVAAYVEKRHRIPAEDVKARIHLISRADLAEWKEGKSGPWDYFAGCDIQRAYICIDEVHNYCGRHHPPKVRKQWQGWLGELRHTGASGAEFISQAPQKIAKELEAESTQTASLVRSDLRRDPVFKILLGDWYELRAVLTREYMAGVWREEYMMYNGRRVKQMARLFRFNLDYFKLYNSYSKPEGGDGAAAEVAPRQEFEKRTAAGLVAWFIKRNAWSLFSRFAVAFIVLAVLLNTRSVFGWWQSAFRVKPIAEATPNKEVAKPDVVPVVDDGLRSALVVKPAAGDTAVSKEAEQIEKLSAELADLEVRYQAAVEELRRTYAVVLITPDEVQFRDGYSYKVGEVVDHGPYKGQRVQSIQWERRYVVMSSGIALRMGLPDADGVSVFPSSPTDAGSGLRASVPTPPLIPQPRAASGSVPRTASNAVSGGNAGSRVPSLDSAQRRNLSRSRIEARRAARNDRSSESASERRVGGGEPTPWRAANPPG